MILRHASFYTISIYINTILAALQGIVAAKLLDPYYMGYFSQIKVILSYMMLINVGFINGLIIVLPKADKKTQDEYISNGFWISFFLYILGAMVFLALYFIVHDKAFLFAAVIFPIYGIKELPIYILRSKGDFKHLSLLYLVISIVTFIIVTILIYLFRFRGALGALSISVSLTLIFGIIIGKIKIEFKIIKHRIISLFKNGIVIYIKEFFRFLKSSMEKLVMMFIMPKEIYAVYTVGIVMISFFDILPATIFQYLLPDFIRKNDKWSEHKMTKTISLITFIITVLLLIGIYIFTLFIPKVLPYYEPSLMIFYILSFTCFINIWNYIIYNKFISENKLQYMYVSQFVGLIALLMAIAIFYGFLGFNESNVIYAAYAILIARIVYIISLLIIFKSKTKLNLFTKETIIVSTLSFATIIISLFTLKHFLHLTIILALMYALLFLNKAKQWLKELMS